MSQRPESVPLPILLPGSGGPPVALTRYRGHDEAWLQEQVHRHPGLLPIETLSPWHQDAVAICRELVVDGGAVDNLLVSASGALTLVECKLGRNRTGKGEVVGQLLRYAAQVASWDYDELDRRIGMTADCKAIAGIEGGPLHHLVAGADTTAGSIERFRAAVTRNLRQGNFLLLIVADELHPDLRLIQRMVQAHPIHGFTVGLVELAILRLDDGGSRPDLVIQPRIPLMTEIVERVAVIPRDDQMLVATAATPVAEEEVAAEVTPFFEALSRSIGTAKAAAIDALLDELVGLGAERVEQRRTYSVNMPRSGAFGPYRLADFYRNGTVIFWGPAGGDPWDGVGTGPGDAYLEALAAALPNGVVVRSGERNAWRIQSDGRTFLPVDAVLAIRHDWLNAARDLACRIDGERP